jgi:protein SCO1/2
MRSAVVILLVLFGTLVAPVCAQQTLAPVQLGIEEHLGQYVPMDVEMYNDSGQVVMLRDVLHKPTILTFVYYRCPGICTPLLNELTKMVQKMDLDLGKDYQILTLSFDPSETPDLSSSKRENYLAAFTKPVDPAGWRFYTADSVNIQRFTSAAGFYFKRDGKDWVHAGVLIFISPEGKITRYMNGIQYLPFDIKMALIEASDGRIGPTIAKVMNFCFSYDPESHRYALNVLRVSLLVILVLVGAFVVAFIVRPRKKIAER